MTTFGGEANSTPAAADAEVVSRLRAGRRGDRGDHDDAGVRRLPLHRVRVAAASPTTRGTAPGRPAAPAAVRRSRWPRGMVPVGMGGDGGGSIRIPSACCGLFGLKPQRGRVTHLAASAPVVRARDRRPAGAHRARQRDRLRRDPRQRAGRPLHRRGPRQLRRGRAPRARAAHRRLVHQAGHPGHPPRPAARPRRRGHRAAAHRPRPRRTSGRPALPRPDGGVRPAVLRRDPRRGRPDGALRAARAPDPGDLPARRLGPARRSSSGRSARPRRSAARPTGSSTRSTSCSRPRSRTARPKVGILDGAGSVESMLRAIPAIAYAALWNVAGNPAAAVPVRPRRRRPPGRGPAGGPAARGDHAAEPLRAARGRAAVAPARVVLEKAPEPTLVALCGLAPLVRSRT